MIRRRGRAAATLVPYAVFEVTKNAMGRFAPLVACGLLAGCHIYEPLHTVEPRVGTRVSAELTGYGSDALAPYVGPRVTALHGYVVSAETTNVVLSVTSVRDRSGLEQSWQGERVRLPRLAIQDFQQRKFSLGRSLLLAAAFLGASAAAWEVFGGGFSGGSLPGPGGGGAPK